MKYDVLVIGPMCGNDLIFAEHLARKGVAPVVVRPTDLSYAQEVPEGYLRAFSPDQIIHTDRFFEFLRIARASRLILAMSAALPARMGWFWPLRRFVGLPPVINLTTGADICEVAMERSPRGMAYRQYLRFVDLNWVPPLPHSLKHVLDLKVENVVFMQGFPFIYTDPAQDPASGADPVPPPASREPSGGPLRLFHCSHLDWNYTDFRPDRVGTKGNERFIRAFIRALAQGLDVTLTLLDRGADRHVAREMLQRAGAADRVVWREQLTREQLFKELKSADVVVNMFDHGGAGGLSMEALALGRPVMQYGDPTFYDLMYGGDMPPFINCRSEEEILERIIWSRRQPPEVFREMGRQGRQWARRHLDPERALTGFLFYYSLLTGDRRLALGPFIPDMARHVDRVRNGRYDPFAGLDAPPYHPAQSAAAQHPADRSA